MRRALIVMSLVLAVAAEAPYHLPRPVANSPVLSYPISPAPALLPQPRPHPSARLPAPVPATHYPQPQPPNFGYNYQAPQLAPQLQPAPQPIYYPHHHQPAPAPIQSPAPQYIPAPAPLPQEIPQPQPISYPQPVAQPRPNPVYGSPQIDIRAAPLPQQNPIIPSYSSSQAAAPTSIAYQQPTAHYQQQQQYQQSGYNYQQPIQAPTQPQIQLYVQPQAQPIQEQAISNSQATNVLSSYQADSYQYNGANEQVHRDALDSIVVNRVQNIIKQDEHSIARNAGYQSLISGVSLENAKPSVEILSFAHTSQIPNSNSAVSAPSLASSAEISYSQPATSNQADSSSSAVSSFNFLPQEKPAIGYGPPS